jgi:RHS repeat-associated protein
MKKLALLIAAALAPVSLLAQNTGLGISQFGSFSGGGFDAVNNQNLNVNFSIPLVSSPGRGMPLNLALTYNSLVWQIVGTSWSPAVDSNGNPTWGWIKDFPSGGAVGWATTTVRIKCQDPGYPLFSYTTTYSSVNYADVLGTHHGFPIMFSLNPNCPSQNYGTNSAYATDATGYHIYVNEQYPDSSPANTTVTDPNGKIVVNGNGTSSDANGNYVTKTVVSSTGSTTETDWTDSTGNKALKIFYNWTNSNQTALTSIQYEFLDGTGSSNYQTITLKYQSYNIKTVFGCSGVGEYSGTVNLPYELDVPSPNGGGTNLTYKFAYEGTPNNSGYYTGRLLKVTLPAGGSYEYDYPTTAPYGINCTDGTTMSVSRKVSDGTNLATWSYLRTGSATAMTNPALPDTPNANDTVYLFNSAGQETSRFIYGNSPGTTLLRTVNTIWSSGTPLTRTVILEDANHMQSQTTTEYDSNGLLDLMIEYDWGQGAPGSAIRQTNYTYQTSPNYTNLNLIDLVVSKQVTNGQQGTVLYRQDITYDGVALASCPTGALQHYDSAYPCTMNYRGNPTQVTTYLSPNTPSNGISKNFTYDWFGNAFSAQVNCCQTQSWTYSQTTQYSHPDSMTVGTSPSPQLTTTYTYNAYTGLQLTATDPNGLKTNSSYDFLRRPTQVSQTIGSTTGESVSYAYDDVNFKTTTTSTIDSSKSIQQVAAMDGLGRTTTSKTEDVGSNVYSIVQAKYDLLGRAYSTSNPYTGSASYWTTTQFDALGRPASITLPDNSQTAFAYATNTITVTDPAGKKRESVTDGAGRLSTVFEPDSTNNWQLTQQTSYTYNVLDELLQVTQGSQIRTYTYDALGRVLSVALPESGTTCFGSVSGSTCNTDGYDQWNNLLKRTDARGVLTSYTYDGLNRPIGVAYTIPNGSGVSAMPNVCDPLGGTNISANICFAYGTSAASFNNGRQITMTDAVGSENYTYNNLGQMTQLQKKINGATYVMSYLYNVAGELTQVTYPSNRVVQQSVDAIGRLCEVATSTTGCGTASTPFATGYGYNTANEATGFKYGNGIYASLGFSADRLQMNCLDYSTTNRNGVCAHDSTTKFGLGYSYGTSGSNNGQISGITDAAQNGRSATYTYDPLSRLSVASTTGSTSYPAWGLQWTYDRYGNRTVQSIHSGCVAPMTCPTNSVTVSPSTNQITTSPSCSPYCYDLSGNMTNDGSNTFVYDGENRATSANNSSVTYAYDGSGLRVQKSIHNGTTTAYVSSGGNVIAEYDNGAAPSSPSREYVYAGGVLEAKIEGSATVYYQRDHLSNRLITDSSGNVAGEQGHFPYGESWYLNNTTTKWEFTTYERDSESGNDYAMARYDVNRLGRFLTPDPMGGSSADPQSLDRYNYVEDDPINLIDPTGRSVTCEQVNVPGGGVVIVCTPTPDPPPPTPPPPPTFDPPDPGAFDNPADDTFFAGTGFPDGGACIKIGEHRLGYSLSQAQAACGMSPPPQQPTIGPNNNYEGSKKQLCDRQSDLAFWATALPGGQTLLNGNFSPGTVGAAVGTYGVGKAIDYAADTPKVLRGVRSIFEPIEVPMSVTSRFLTGISVALAVKGTYDAFEAMKDTYQACMAN